jgi:hypothetical protein
MVEQPFDRETLLDVTVNIIPLGILIFFTVLFLVITPWGGLLGDDTLVTGIVFGHMTFTMVALCVITYVSAKFISRDEP